MDNELTEIMGAVLKNILREVNTALENKDFENYKYWQGEFMKFFTPSNLTNLNGIAGKLK